MLTKGANTERKLNRRDFLRLTTLATGGAVLAACAAPAGPAAPQADTQTAGPALDEDVVVEAWAHWEQGLQWLQDAMDNYGFSEEHPNITLDPVVAPFNEIHDKML